jgi:hypothetical protein
MSERRLRPKVVIQQNSPNQSERTPGIKLAAIVIHSTESHNRPGTSDLLGVAGWLCNPQAQASAHVIVDADGHTARIVPDHRKAWHCGSFNSATLGIEQIGFAAQGKDEWLEDGRELWETARHIARWSMKFNIPLRRGKVSGVNVTKSGILTHGDLGTAGGGHTDPGAYPIVKVIERASEIKRLLRRG